MPGRAQKIEYFVLYCEDADATCAAFTEHFGLSEIEVKLTGGRKYRVAGSNATVVVFCSNSPDIDMVVAKRGTFIYDVAYRVDSVEGIGPESFNNWTIYWQDDTDVASVITVGNNNSYLRHTLVSPKKPSDDTLCIVLPGLSMEIPKPSAKYGLTHVDHFTFVIPAGTTTFWINLYAELGFVRHKINSQDDPETGFQTTPDEGGAGLDTMVVTTDVNAFCIGFIAPYGIKHGHIGLYLRNNHGAGVQHLALHTDTIYDSIDLMRAAGVKFIPIKKMYYDDPAIIEPLKSVKEDIERFTSQQLLFDTEGKNEEGVYNYLLQTFTLPHPVQRTLFFEVISRRGARGFGAGNIGSLVEGAEADLSKHQEEILSEHCNAKASVWNIRQLLETIGEVYHDRTAFVIGEDSFDYKNTYKNIIKVAKWLLDSGVKQLDRVALLAGSSYMSILTVLGCWFMGAVPVMLNPEEDIDTVRNLGERAKVKYITCMSTEDKLAKELQDLIENVELLLVPKLAELKEVTMPIFINVVGQTETCIIMQTGAGGSRPKLVPLSHQNIIANLEMTRQAFWIATFNQPYAKKADGSLCWLPIHRFLGFLEIINNMYCGASTTLFATEMTPTNFLTAIEKSKCTYCYLLPQLLTQLHKECDETQLKPLANLRCCLFASTPVGNQVFDEFGKMGVKFMGIMGMAECGGFMFMSHLGTDPNLLRPVPGMGMLITLEKGLPKGVGELIVMDNMACIDKYLDETEDVDKTLTPTKGELHTNEMFKLQPDGSYKWLCRKTELVDVTMNAQGEIQSGEKSRTKSSPMPSRFAVGGGRDRSNRAKSDAADVAKAVSTSKHHFHSFATVDEVANTVPFVHYH